MKTDLRKYDMIKVPLRELSTPVNFFVMNNDIRIFRASANLQYLIPYECLVE